MLANEMNIIVTLSGISPEDLDETYMYTMFQTWFDKQTSLNLLFTRSITPVYRKMLFFYLPYTHDIIVNYSEYQIKLCWVELSCNDSGTSMLHRFKTDVSSSSSSSIRTRTCFEVYNKELYKYSLCDRMAQLPQMSWGPSIFCFYALSVAASTFLRWKSPHKRKHTFTRL